MKKKARVIQISGLRGILLVVFIGTCLCAGFVAFPSICAMHIWNYVANFVSIPLINIYQGAMLWAIIAITGFIINDREKFLVEFSASDDELNDKDMQKLMERIKLQSQAQALNSMILKSSELKTLSEIKPIEKIEKIEKVEKQQEEKESEKESV